jgi:hypothetical protein
MLKIAEFAISLKTGYKIFDPHKEHRLEAPTDLFAAAKPRCFAENL